MQGDRSSQMRWPLLVTTTRGSSTSADCHGACPILRYHVVSCLHPKYERITTMLIYVNKLASGYGRTNALNRPLAVCVIISCRHYSTSHRVLSTTAGLSAGSAWNFFICLCKNWILCIFIKKIQNVTFALTSHHMVSACKVWDLDHL